MADDTDLDECRSDATCTMNSDTSKSKTMIMHQKAPAKVWATYELLENILTNLDPRQIVQLRGVNTAFRSVIDTSPTICEGFAFTLPISAWKEAFQNDNPRMVFHGDRSLHDLGKCPAFPEMCYMRLLHPLHNTKLFTEFYAMLWERQRHWHIICRMNVGVFTGMSILQSGFWRSMWFGGAENKVVTMNGWAAGLGLGEQLLNMELVSDDGITLEYLMEAARKWLLKNGDACAEINFVMTVDCSGRDPSHRTRNV